MRKFLPLACLFALLVASPVAAEVFTVTLTSGSKFVTRYQPHQASQDDMIQLMTEFGNWITLPKSVVASITSDTEAKGFGTVLDSQTIALGWVPPSSGAATGGDATAAPQDPTAQLLQFMQQQSAPAPAPVYSNDLVVEPSQSSGIPMGLIGRP